MEDLGGTEDDIKPQEALQLLEISSAGLGVPLQPPVSHPTGTLLRFLCGLMADSTMSFWLFWESSQSRGCSSGQAGGHEHRKFSVVGLPIPDTWPQAWGPGGDPAPACLDLASLFSLSASPGLLNLICHQLRQGEGCHRAIRCHL